MPDREQQQIYNGFLSRKGALAALLLVAGSLTTTHAGAADPDFELKVRPSICVSYDSASPCVMSMQLSWASPRIADVCLREAQREAPLRCWDDALGGQHEIQYADTVDSRYWLVDANTQLVLAETEVVVINRDLRDSRKRRRHVWSIL